MAMPDIGCEDDVVAAVGEAAGRGARLQIAGGGSKAAIGAPAGAAPLPLAGLSGIVDYDPAELVLTVRPGTPLRDVEALVAGERQMLAFEPFDHGPIFGAREGAATIGGVVAAGAGGSRCVSAGRARDHVLGVRAVSGRGELFVAGARVIKNVTGYDLPKLAAGSWGRLFAITELTLKVLPRCETSATLAVEGLTPAAAVQAMARALGSRAGVAAAAHRPGRGGGRPMTAVRLEGFEPSVRARAGLIVDLLAPFGAVAALDERAADQFWDDLRTLAPLGSRRPLWRIDVAPSAGGTLADTLAEQGADTLLDWAGGLVWAAFDGDPALIRARAESAGGHATLIRAGEALRRSVPAFHPRPAGLAALEERVRRAFDPVGVFETGRF